MTIDEAIEREKFKARIDRIKANKRIFHNNDKDEINACNRSAEEHEQISEWLEELKAYRECNVCEYNKAIDDMNKAFEKIIEKLEEKLKKSEERYNRYLDDNNLYCMFDKSNIEDTKIDTIKEMLKIVHEVSEEYTSTDGWIPIKIRPMTEEEKKYYYEYLLKVMG